MTRASEDDAPHATAGGCDGDGDTDVGNMLELFLIELDALERHSDCTFHDDGDLVMASLIATTEAVDTTGFCVDSLTVPTDVIAATTNAATEKRAPRKRKRIRPTGTVNTHYKRQKEELASLRGGVEALKSQLEVLHARHREQRCSEDSHGSLGARTDDSNATRDRSDDDKATERGFDDLATLKARAARELDSRQQTALENARLRKLANDTRDFTRSMEDTFAKHPMPSMADLFEVSPALRVINPTDAQVYRELECCLDARYAGVGLMREGFGCCPSVGNSINDLRTISTLMKNEQSASVLLNNSRVLPFPVQVISDVVWGGNNLDLLHAKDATIKVVQRFESTVFLNKQYNIRDPDNQEVIVTMRMVLRRFTAKDCIYLAWESLGEWPSTSSLFKEALGGATSKRFVIREHGWGSVLPFPDPKSHSPVSTLRASTIVEPDVVGDAYEEQSLHQALVQLLSDAVAPSHQVAFAARMQQLENMLLDHSIQMKL